MKGFIVKNEHGEVINFETEEAASQEEIEKMIYVFGTSAKNCIIFPEKWQADSAAKQYLKPFTKMAIAHPLPEMSVVEVEVKVVMQEV